MNRLLKFFYRYQNQRMIYRAPFWTIVKMAWAQSGRMKDIRIKVDNEIIDISLEV